MSGNGGEAEEGWDGRNRSFLAGRHRDFADRYARLGLEFVWFYNVTNHPEHNGSIAWFYRPFYFDRATCVPPIVLNVLRSWLRRAKIVQPGTGGLAPFWEMFRLTHKKKLKLKDACIFYWHFSTWHGRVFIFGVGNFLSQTLHASLGVAEKTPLPCVAVCGVGLEEPWLCLRRIDRETYITSYLLFIDYHDW